MSRTTYLVWYKIRCISCGTVWEVKKPNVVYEDEDEFDDDFWLCVGCGRHNSTADEEPMASFHWFD